MNAHHQAHQAYAQINPGTRSERSIEYDLFARITKKLAANSKESSKNSVEFVSALHENRRLWTVLASAVAEDENMLPSNLRAQLFYLAEFTGQHTSKVLRKEASADILCEINLSIMQGLQSKATPV